MRQRRSGAPGKTLSVCGSRVQLSRPNLPLEELEQALASAPAWNCQGWAPGLGLRGAEASGLTHGAWMEVHPHKGSNPNPALSTSQ